MKIRMGFVSNSSGSSFCYYGVYLTQEDVRVILIQAGIKPDDDEGDFYEATDKAEKVLAEAGLTSHYLPEPDEDNALMVGREWSSVEDNETGAQFKQDVKDKLEKLLNKSVKCATHEKHWSG